MSVRTQNNVFVERIKSLYEDKAEQYLHFFNDSLNTVEEFLESELPKTRKGQERVIVAQQAIGHQFLISRLINFTQTTRINLKRVLNKEQSDLKSALVIIKKDLSERFELELSKLTSKKDKEDFTKLLLDSNKDYCLKLEDIEDLKHTEEAFFVEGQNLERVKKTLEEFIMVLKKEVH